jgi:hypothetical protein
MPDYVRIKEQISEIQDTALELTSGSAASFVLSSVSSNSAAGSPEADRRR